MIKIDDNYSSTPQFITVGDNQAAVYNGSITFLRADENEENRASILTLVNTVTDGDILWYRDDQGDLQSTTLSSVQSQLDS